MIMENNNTIACNITIGKSIDIDTIAQFQMAMAMESEGTALDADKVHRGVTAAINDSNKGTYLIAKIGDKAVGSLMLTREWSDWNNCWYWWVQSVYVLPQYRGKGIYRAMYAHVKQLAKEQSITQVRLYVDKTNLSAQSVYNKLGMSECHYLMYEEEL